MKQVIIVRKDLNMRKGKMIAQGAHASLSAVLKVLNTPDYKIWDRSGHTKIVVGAISLDQLLDLHRQACNAGIVCALILDAGHTEFKEPTYTALAIGPAEGADIDKITGNLILL